MKLLNLLKQIKSDYIREFRDITYDCGECRSCIERWVNELPNQEYKEIFLNLITNQWKNYVLIRYDSYINLFSKESNTYSEFWDMWDGLYRECRSVVVDVKTMSFVMRPFDKFFNMDEREETSYGVIAQKFERADVVTVTNKLDGSMQCGRYYNGEFIMSGSQAIDPESSWRLEDGYSMLTESYRNMLQDYDEYTFIFEYISKEDAHVVVYDESDYGLHLIGARHVLTGEYMSYDQLWIIAHNREIPITTQYEMDLGQLVDTLGQYTSDVMEGYVVRFTDECGDFFVKIKCDDYVKMHGIVSSLQSPNIILKHIMEDTFDDFFSKIPPSRQPQVMEIASTIFNYNTSIKKRVEVYGETCMSHHESLKDRMIWITNNCPQEIAGWVRNYIKGERRTNFIKPGMKWMDILTESLKSSI